MADKSIVTQSQLGPLKLALAQEGDSLLFHVNDSLSKAHGFSAWAGPNPDAYGNDLRYYCDSAGDVVGVKMMRLDLGNTTFYAPLLVSTVPGQTATAGTTVDLTRLLQPGPNFWVTDFSDQFTTDANLVMSGLLLPHTRQSYWEYGTTPKAHGGVSAVALDSFDSAGHKVGNFALVFIVNTQTIYIPASDHMGGPVQPPRIPNPCPVKVADSGNFIYNGCGITMNHGSGSPADTAHVQWTGFQGTAPFNYQIQVSNNALDPIPIWQDATLNTSYPYANTGGLTANSASYPAYQNPSGTCNQTLDWSFTLFNPGPGASGTMWIRLKLSNAGGTTYAPTLPPTAQAITIHIQP